MKERKPKQKCPECQKDYDLQFYPFCSERCRTVDLGRWLKGHYILPRQFSEEDEELGVEQGVLTLQ